MFFSVQTLKRATDGPSQSRYTERRKSFNVNLVLLGDSRPIRLARVYDDITVFPEEDEAQFGLDEDEPGS